MFMLEYIFIILILIILYLGEKSSIEHKKNIKQDISQKLKVLNISTDNNSTKLFSKNNNLIENKITIDTLPQKEYSYVETIPSQENNPGTLNMQTMSSWYMNNYTPKMIDINSKENVEYKNLYHSNVNQYKTMKDRISYVDINNTGFLNKPVSEIYDNLTKTYN